MSTLLIYIIIAISIGLTSYITIYRPAIDLYEEITETELSLQKGIIFQTFWIFSASLLAPIIAVILLQGKNKEHIKNLVLHWIGDEDE